MSDNMRLDQRMESAVAAALERENKRAKAASPAMIISTLLYLALLVWALMLASRVAPGPYRTLHLTMAILFAPAYVLAHYIGAWQESKPSYSSM